MKEVRLGEKNIISAAKAFLIITKLKRTCCREIYTLKQWWEISGPQATCGPPERFQWPAEAFMKNV